MTKTPEESLVDLAKLAGEVTQAVVEAETQVLHMVQAEMDALGNLVLMPPKHPATEAERLAEEEAVEEGFDNMPV